MSPEPARRDPRPGVLILNQENQPMPSGGKREGAGRKPGARNKRTEAAFEAAEKAAAAIEEHVPGAFAGDAHALLMAVYKDPKHEWALRIDAAKAAVRYEKPALSSVEATMSGELRTGPTVDVPERAETPEEWHARRKRELAAMGTAAGASVARH